MKGRKGGVKKASSMSPTNPTMSKTQKKVTHWLRQNVATKKTKFLHSHIVEYFSGRKAVDALFLESPWSEFKSPDASSALFHSRQDVTEYLDELLKHKMFHRAKKIPLIKRSGLTGSKEIRGIKNTSNEKVEVVDEVEEGDERSKKGKRKIRLDMHLDQIFLDTQDAYVWLYDPIPWYYWAGGTLIVASIIAVCLFPLWPPLMRKGVHYLVVIAAGFLICIIPIALLKYILYGVLLLLTSGKLKFWLLPNLTEDVGFFESFVPLYDYTYTVIKKDKESDGEEESDNDENDDEDNENENSSSDDSTSKKSSNTGKDFEIVSKNDETE